MGVTAEGLRAIPMREAVGYDTIEFAEESGLDARVVLKHDRLFLLVEPNGEIGSGGQSALGLFHDDTRILSRYRLHVTGGPPALLSSQVPAQYHAQIDLAISNRFLGGDVWDPKNAIHLRREIVLHDRMIERLNVTSFLTTPIDFTVELEAACDFADIFEVRGWKRTGRGQFFVPEITDRSISFLYRDRAGSLLRSTICFTEAPTRIHQRGAVWQFQLHPNRRHVIEWQIVPGAPVVAVSTGGDLSEHQEPVRRMYDSWRNECSRWNTDVAEFNHALRHAVDDLRALYVGSEEEEVISAGIPWYSTVFGRDSIITSLQTLPLNSRIAVDTLRYLARHQGTKEDPYTEEQPGRILHELRRGEMARSGEIPHTPYYGTVDATPLWLALLHETWRWTADQDLVRSLLPNAMRALEWIDRWGDLDGDHFVEYARTSAKGLVNQGWKDSGDGVPFPDGTLPEPPIALVEIQGYVYDAKVRMASLLATFGDADAAHRLSEEAIALRKRILDAFWSPEIGCFALALDGHKRPLPTVTTNAGHLLWSRAATPEQARAVADHMLGEYMFSGWGIRTLSGRHPVYNPMSYHNGSIWPHDNALVVMGMAHYGLGRRALPAVEALHDAAVHMKYHRLPELFCGMRRASGLRPVLYPVSCSPQAWASGAFFMLLQAVLGILPDAPNNVLHIREPQLPLFLDRLTVSGLRIGRSLVGLEFRRHGDRTLANLLGIEGEPLRVRIDLA